jgi:hypothetical protein
MFADNFVNAIGGHPASPTLAEYYLVFPDNPVLRLGEAWEPISNETFAIRLG